MDAVSEIRRALDNSVPLIGFSGSPYTLALLHGRRRGSSDFRRIKTMLYDRPDLLHRILAVTADTVTAYLNAQIDSGAQAVMIFDTWGGSLSAAAYREFSLAYMARIVAGLKREKGGERVPSIVFTKNGGLWLEKTSLPSVAMQSDWTGPSTSARRVAGLATRWRSRATWIPMCLCVAGGSLPPRPSRSWTAMVRGKTGHVLQPRPWHFPIHSAGNDLGLGGNRSRRLPKSRLKVIVAVPGVFNLCTVQGPRQKFSNLPPLTPLAGKTTLENNGFFGCPIFRQSDKILLGGLLVRNSSSAIHKVIHSFGDNLKKLNNLGFCCVFGETTLSIKPWPLPVSFLRVALDLPLHRFSTIAGRTRTVADVGLRFGSPSVVASASGSSSPWLRTAIGQKISCGPLAKSCAIFRRYRRISCRFASLPPHLLPGASWRSASAGLAGWPQTLEPPTPGGSPESRSARWRPYRI